MSFANATVEEVRTFIGAARTALKLTEALHTGHSVSPDTANAAEIAAIDAAVAALELAIVPVSTGIADGPES